MLSDLTIRTAKIFPRMFPGEDFARRKQNYEPAGGVVSAAAGDSAGDSTVAGADSIGIEVAVDSSFVGAVVAAGVAAGSVVSVFCSHAARSAAPASMQMYFFIV